MRKSYNNDTTSFDISKFNWDYLKVNRLVKSGFDDSEKVQVYPGDAADFICSSNDRFYNDTALVVRF